jgi:hypothetical protein
MQRFHALETRPRVNGCFVGHMEEDDGQAFFLAWLYDQTHWQEELRELIHEQMGDRSPQRILVIDEFVCEGSTWMLTLGLLNLILPDANVHFHNANLEYKASIFLEWLRVLHPELLNSELVSTGMEFHDLTSQAQRMVLGTEDIDPESLRWKTIEPTSVCFEKLDAYLPVQKWFDLPQFALQVVQNEIAAHASEYVPGPVESYQRYPQLQPGILIMREIYRHGPLTLQEISRYLNWSVGKARYHADRQISRMYLVSQRDGRLKRFALSPRTSPGYEDRDDSVCESYWVLPNRLLAGEFPGSGEEYDKDRVPARLQSLVDAGVTCFIDLSYESRSREGSYGSILQNMAAEQNRDIQYLRFPTPVRRLPQIKKIRNVLRELDRSITAGRVVYIHDYFGYTTETVLGCYLVQQGLSGPEAIRELECVRLGVRDGWRRSPAKESARRLVRRWTSKIQAK